MAARALTALAPTDGAPAKEEAVKAVEALPVVALAEETLAKAVLPAVETAVLSMVTELSEDLLLSCGGRALGCCVEHAACGARCA